MTTSLRLVFTRFGFAVLVAVLVLSARPAAADELYGEHRGINRVRKGVFEVSFASLFAFANDTQGDASIFRLVTDLNGTVSYFFRDNLSVDVTGLLGYQTTGDDNSAITYGGALGGTAHLRLGFGAFFRPGLAAGVLLGNREIPVGGTTVMEASQLGFTARLRLPIAYFISRNLHLEAGPQFNLTVGSYSPEGADSVSFTTIDGGFSVGAGYSF
jgi:hypothetical protein